MKQVVYAPGSPLRSPGKLLSDLWRDVLAARELAWRLFVRNISARYRQTLLGYFWAVFPPLATAGIWLMLTESEIVQIDVSGVSYPVFLITGTILWQSFVDAVQIPIRVVSESKQMLAKINFPRESLPMTAFAECWFNVTIRIMVLALVYLYLGFTPAVTVILLPVGLLAIILFGMFLGVLLSPFALLYNDVQSSLLLVLQVWFYCTPVIYAPSLDGFLGTLSLYNPVAPLLNQTRDWLIGGESLFLSEAVMIFSGTLMACVLVTVVYRVALPRAIERISS